MSCSWLHCAVSELKWSVCVAGGNAQAPKWVLNDLLCGPTIQSLSISSCVARLWGGLHQHYMMTSSSLDDYPCGSCTTAVAIHGATATQSAVELLHDVRFQLSCFV
jgi:hypothetical protein